MLQKKLSVKSMGNNGRNSLTDDTGFLQGFFKTCLKRPILIYFFPKMKKKIKILDKEFYDGKN